MRRPASHTSILWWAFAANAVVFSAAVLTLIVSPATIHSHIRFTELVVLIVGLFVTLLIDLAALALVFAPLRRLARLMGDIDPMRPGQRAHVGPFSSAEASILAGAFNNMLDRIEGERRESARRALAAQEAERLRIARELHDEVGQALTAVALQAERAAGEHSSQAHVLGDITKVIHASLDDVRRIARELRPEALDDLGLADALIALCLRVERQGSIRIRRELEGSLPRLSAEAELVIYRVAQEALTNALRHSHASQVSLALRQHRGAVLLSVEDDGRGLPAALADGSGLTGMRERAILIESDLQVGRSAEGGVRIALAVPVAATALAGA